jgi:hypothetical protein
MYSETPDIFDQLTGQSATHEIMNSMELYGATPPTDEVDPRPMPDQDHSFATLEVVFDSLAQTFADTCLESEATDVLWNTVNVFQRKLDRLDKGFDQLAFEIRRSMREQDGTEVKSVELEKLEIRATATNQARDYFETLRDHAAELFSVQTGQPWMPARGSRTSRSNLTAAVVDSREFLAATERKKTQALAPEGPKVVVAGGMNFNDHTLIFDALDKVHSKHPDMVLVHGGAPKGSDLIAAKWAAARKIDQVVFKPDWNKYGKSRAGFVRNDQMLELLPIGVIAFPGTGITENLVDKARGMGIPIKKYA